MALHFSRVGPATAELEIWSASEGGFSFVISNESSSGPGLRGRPGFVASWRPIHINRSARSREPSARLPVAWRYPVASAVYHRLERHRGPSPTDPGAAAPPALGGPTDDSTGNLIGDPDCGRYQVLPAW